jgi:ketosteroid isomerase-like protein
MKGELDALVRRRVADWARAISARDLDRVLEVYAPAVVSFDLDPPLCYAGTDTKRRAWEDFFAAHPGPLTYDVHDLDIELDRDLAFAHSLNRVSDSGGDMWVRWTACFQRIDGEWLIVHDHVSVPVHVPDGRAALNLTP